MPKQIKEKIEEMEREIVMILDEEYGHQDVCDRNPDKICSCPIGLVVDRLEDFSSQILELFSQREKEVLERAENLIETRLDYCRKQNGLPYCKNCGLCEEDIKAIKKVVPKNKEVK